MQEKLQKKKLLTQRNSKEDYKLLDTQREHSICMRLKNFDSTKAIVEQLTKASTKFKSHHMFSKCCLKSSFCLFMS